MRCVLSSVGQRGRVLFVSLALIGLCRGLIEGKSHHNNNHHDNNWAPHDYGAPASQGRQHSQAGGSNSLSPQESRDEICKFPSKVRFPECQVAKPAWFYHKSTRECTYLPDGDCDGDQLTRGFESEDECESTCFREEEEDWPTFSGEPEFDTELELTSCELPDEPPRPGCLLPLPVWFYNNSEGKCVEYSEGVCGVPSLGNSATNQGFPSENECKIACRRHRQAPKQTSTGTRTKTVSRTTTTTTTTTRLPVIQRTTQAVVTTPSPSPNAYKTTSKRPSDSTTTTTLGPATSTGKPDVDHGANWRICNLPIEIGPCRALMPAWYYNRTMGQCRKFTYSGCGGNENNFRSQAECAQTCPLARRMP